MFREVVNLQFLVGHRQIIYIFWIWFIEWIASLSSMNFSYWCKDSLSCISSI
jgi:hypothetical protein